MKIRKLRKIKHENNLKIFIAIILMFYIYINKMPYLCSCTYRIMCMNNTMAINNYFKL